MSTHAVTLRLLTPCTAVYCISESSPSAVQAVAYSIGTLPAAGGAKVSSVILGLGQLRQAAVDVVLVVRLCCTLPAQQASH